MKIWLEEVIYISWSQSWVRVWKTKNFEIVIGWGSDLGEGSFGPFQIKNRRWKCFWWHTARPTLAFINKRG